MAYLDSNEPISRVQHHDPVWSGMGIGAASGLGAMGVVQAGMKGFAWKDPNRGLKMNADDTLIVTPKGNARDAGTVKDRLLGSNSHQNRYNAMFGGKRGWMKKAGMYAAAGIIGGALGAATDYMTD
jgi:hypothetical protein